jgi:serine/threonine-protein kinase
MKKNYTISVSASIFWKVIVPAAVLCAAIGGLGGVLLVDKIIMPRIVHVDRGMVTVPAITDMPWEDARQALFNVGLRLQIGSRQFDEKVPRDRIISQQPLAQESVRKGRLVVVAVSKGSEIGTIPVVIDMPERKGTLELKKAGFIIGKVKRDFFDDHPKDAVAALVPKEGTTISKGMPIDVVVSDGPKPTHIDVPNVIGESLIAAKDKIEKIGLKLGKIDYQQNSTVSPGTVISQSVPPASSVPLESAVNIVVSVKN